MGDKDIYVAEELVNRFLFYVQPYYTYTSPEIDPNQTWFGPFDDAKNGLDD